MKKMLSDCEEKVMAVIWKSSDELDLQQIKAEVNRRFGKKWAQQTVSTFLRRIVAKGYLSKRRSGRVFFYTPLISREEYLEEKLTRIAKDFGISIEDIRE